MVINLRVKTLDSQDHEFTVDDDVSQSFLSHIYCLRTRIVAFFRQISNQRTILCIVLNKILFFVVPCSIHIIGFCSMSHIC